MKTKKKIGLLCGSFNPIHIGHLALANYFYAFSSINAIWFVVSPHNPLKEQKSLLCDIERLKMTQLAIGNFTDFSACDVEFHLPKPSYTINTLHFLQEKYPDTEFILIIGEDNLGVFEQWKNYREILDNYQIYVYSRSGSIQNPLFSNERNVTFSDAPLLNISSTWIRNAIREGKNMRFFLPEKVFDYIKTNGFYQS